MQIKATDIRSRPFSIYVSKCRESFNVIGKLSRQLCSDFTHASVTFDMDRQQIIVRLSKTEGIEFNKLGKRGRAHGYISLNMLKKQMTIEQIRMIKPTGGYLVVNSEYIEFPFEIT